MPDLKGYIQGFHLYDILEKEKVETQKTHQWLPEARDGEGSFTMGQEMMKLFFILVVVVTWLYTSVKKKKKKRVYQEREILPYVRYMQF